MNDIARRWVAATLPIPPSVNALYRNVARVGRVKTAAYRAWIAAAAKAIGTQPAIEPPYLLTIYLPLRMRGDISNRVKALEDALVAAGVMVDDSRVYALMVCRKAQLAAGECQFIVTTEGAKWWATRKSATGRGSIRSFSSPSRAARRGRRS